MDIDVERRCIERDSSRKHGMSGWENRLLFKKMEVQWIYNIPLVLGVQQSDSIIYIFFIQFFSIIVYFKISSIVLCAIQWILVAYLFYI